MARGKPLDVIAGARLNDREVQVLYGLARGLEAEQIGAALGGISKNTIYTYSKRIRIKLVALNNHHAIALGFVRGYLKAGKRVTS